AIELEIDQRVGARLGVEDAEHLLRVDGHGHAFRRLAFFARAVDDRGDPACDAEPPRLVLATAVTLLCVECRVHKSSIRTTKRRRSPRECCESPVPGAARPRAPRSSCTAARWRSAESCW